MGLLGRKVGMTRVFTDDGHSLPVSVIYVMPNRISQIKRSESDGYTAVQITTGTKKLNRVGKPLAGHFAKAQIEPGDFIREFHVDSVENYTLGQTINLSEVLKDGEYVDVSGISKGKGFAGTVKRHNFRTQDASHGNSRSHRVPGSIGQNQTPGKVFKGKKMSGQLGNERCTTLNLEVVRVDTERNLLMIKGAIPGCPGAALEIRPAVKKAGRGK